MNAKEALARLRITCDEDTPCSACIRIKTCRHKEALAVLRAVVEASPASPDIRPAGYNGPLSGHEAMGQPAAPAGRVSREWLRFQAGEIWSAKTIEDAVDTLADTLKGFGVEVEGE